MQQILGCEVTESLYESGNTRVLRARRLEDDRPVVIKVSPPEVRTLQQEQKYLREFQLGSQLDHPNIIRYYAIERVGVGAALIIEDFGAVSLSQMLNEEGMDLELFLKLAVQLTQGVVAIHLKDIVHKDLKPSNVVVNVNTQVAKIIDFGISSQLDQESQQTYCYLHPHSAMDNC